MKRHCVLSVASAVGLSCSILLSGYTTIAQTSSTLVQSQSSAANVGFVPPADDGAPAYSRGGATRNPECDALQVLPENGSGLTAETRPMLQAYFQAGVKRVWVKIESDDGSELYTYGEDEYFTLPEGKGFAEVPLPDSLVELTPNKRYSWTMALLCDSEFDVNSPSVKGGIQRVDSIASLAETASMSLQEKTRVYAEAGLWYDYISALTLMKEENPDSMQLLQNWEAALRAVDLGIIFDEFEAVE